MELHDDGRVAVQRRDGAWRDAHVLGTSYVAPGLTVLNLKTAGRVLREHVVLLPDSADRDEVRRLRVLLRWKHRALAAGGVSRRPSAGAAMLPP